MGEGGSSPGLCSAVLWARGTSVRPRRRDGGRGGVCGRLRGRGGTAGGGPPPPFGAGPCVCVCVPLGPRGLALDGPCLGTRPLRWPRDGAFGGGGLGRSARVSVAHGGRALGLRPCAVHFCAFSRDGPRRTTPGTRRPPAPQGLCRGGARPLTLGPSHGAVRSVVGAEDEGGPALEGSNDRCSGTAPPPPRPPLPQRQRPLRSQREQWLARGKRVPASVARYNAMAHARRGPRGVPPWPFAKRQRMRGGSVFDDPTRAMPQKRSRQMHPRDFSRFVHRAVGFPLGPHSNAS